MREWRKIFRACSQELKTTNALREILETKVGMETPLGHEGPVGERAAESQASIFLSSGPTAPPLTIAPKDSTYLHSHLVCVLSRGGARG